MRPWLPVLLAALAGWGITRWHRHLKGAPGTLTGTVLWGVCLTGTTLAGLDLLGIRWSPSALALPAIAAALAGMFARPPGTERDDGTLAWGAVAAAAVVGRALTLAAVPAFGWDFRYSWGLKAKVFAAAGCHDFAWLTRAPDWLAHPDYPPLWPDLIASGAVFGGGAAAAATAWQVLLVIGIAAACWQCSAPAPPPLRAVAAVLGGWIPVVLTPSVAYSGYAEPLIAFAISVGVAVLVQTGGESSGRWLTAAAVGATLTMTKDEGLALAIALSIAAWRAAARRTALATTLAAFAAIAGWRVAAALHGVRGTMTVLSLRWVVGRIVELPHAFLAVVTPTDAALLLAWAAALLAIRGSDGPPMRLFATLWGCALLAAYLTSPLPLEHMLRFSLDRELAVALPITIAVSLRRADIGRLLRPAIGVEAVVAPATPPAGRPAAP